MTLERIDVVPTLPPRPADSHKGRFGFVLAIAGSRGMAGAAGLVGQSALRSGAGLVRVACVSEIQAVVAGYEPSYMTHALEADEDGRLCDLVNRSVLLGLIEAATVVAVGPGLGRSEELGRLVAWLLETSDRPMVVDADALNALGADWPARLSERARPTILTPHPGEMSRLVGRSVADVQADREAVAAEAARSARGTVVVLKGEKTVVTDGRRVFVNTTGNPGMATGGTGDVLTGVIAALVGQGLDAFEAAVLGVHTHGLAGDLACRRRGEVGLIASDLVAHLPEAWVSKPAGRFGF
jgi:NAD(P)H-hydrate epimerase